LKTQRLLVRPHHPHKSWQIREVNRIAMARGEQLHYGAETTENRPKRIGIVTRALARQGKACRSTRPQ